MLSLLNWHLVLRVKSLSFTPDLEARWDHMPYPPKLLRRRKRSQNASKELKRPEDEPLSLLDEDGETEYSYRSPSRHALSVPPVDVKE
ncbi:MAG: hypothetical protein Q9191_007124 [Dirinaria sp. TL-2023a]